MSDFNDLISIMQQQLEQQRKEHKAEMELQREQLDAVLQQRDAECKQRDQQHKAELDALLSLVAKKSTEGMSTPSFAPFDSTTELFQDYWSRFCTFVAANSIPDERKAQLFLTSQSPALYKQLSNLAAQKTPKKRLTALPRRKLLNSWRTNMIQKTIHCEGTIQLLE